VGWAENGEGWLFGFFLQFLLFPVQAFTQKLFQNFRQTFDHTINSKSMHST
jgi:hypothetical protein